MISYPLGKQDISAHADGAIVVVLAAADVAESLPNDPIWIRGIGWCNDAPSLETRAWGRAIYAEEAGKMAYKMAGIRNPMEEIDFAEIDDGYSYKELQHLEALGFCQFGEAGIITAEGVTEPDGYMPVNVSGGSLGCGHLLGRFRAAGRCRDGAATARRGGRPPASRGGDWPGLWLARRAHHQRRGRDPEQLGGERWECVR